MYWEFRTVTSGSTQVRYKLRHIFVFGEINLFGHDFKKYRKIVDLTAEKAATHPTPIQTNSLPTPLQAEMLSVVKGS